MKIVIAFVFLLLVTTPLFAQRLTITGIVKTANGENLPMANVRMLPDSAVSTSDRNGQFTFRTYQGEKEFIVSFTGFETSHVKVFIASDTTISLQLGVASSQLDAVTIYGTRYAAEDLVRSTRTGTTTLSQRDITAIPVLGGEADLIKTLQLLPGTVRGVEGSSDLFVRGGAADQNLVLLDGAPIYNTTHMFGFLSVFNPSILDRVEAMNGAFPAEYGGRLSSILDIASRSRLAQSTHGSGDIGLIASRLFLEQPLIKNKASIWLSGRRTYVDQVAKAIGEELPYYFYDLNGKVILQPTPANKVELSFYTGDDRLDIFRDHNNDGHGFLTSYTSGNASAAFHWTHAFRSGWQSSVTATRSAFHYYINNVFEENSLRAFSDIEDYSARMLFSRDSVLHNSNVRIGAEWTRHAISPNIIHSTGSISELLSSSSSPGKLAHEVAAHLEDEFQAGRKWLVTAGFRISAGVVPGRNYFVPEPRMSARYALSKEQSLKVSYSRMAQYMHRISNSAITTPADVWYTVTDDIAPQTSHQVAVAWHRFSQRNGLFISAEAYYKRMRDLVGYEEGTNLFFNTDFESSLIQGKGRAFGLELLLRKDAGRFTGWISYSLARTDRQYESINGGTWFPSRYDRRHNGALVSQYAVGRRWAFSLVWEFISGARFTPIIGQYVALAPTLTGFDLIPVYSPINGVKLADSHRLDLGVKFLSRPGHKFQWQWFAGVYNVYNRTSPVGMIIEQNEADGSLRYLQPGLFGALPFISYGFKF